MAVFKCEIRMDNEAFVDNAGQCESYELARILRETAERLADSPVLDFECPLMDINGNKVGRAWVEEEVEDAEV